MNNKAIVLVFCSWTRREDICQADIDSAVRWLLRLRMRYYKTEAECWDFVQDRIFGHAELLAAADDEQALFLVEKEFEAYLKYLCEKERDRQKLFPVVSLDETDKKNLYRPDTPPSGRPRTEQGGEKLDWRGLTPPTNAEVAQDARQTKADPFAQFLQNLKDRRDKESKLYLSLIRETLRDNATRSATPEGRVELALERSLLRQAMVRSPRIRSIVYKRSREK